MMKRFIKYLPGLLLMCLAVFVVSSCSDEDSEHIAGTQLPKEANAFLNIYYPAVKIAKVVQENENGAKVYNVTLSNVHKIIFNATGNWLEVDAPAGQNVPRGFYPQAINVYLVENEGSWEIINSISRETYGYEIVLISGKTLDFTSDGQIMTQAAE